MLGMSLDAGGHLTHGFRPNISGKIFDQSSYGVDPDHGTPGLHHIAALARQVRPLILLAGYSAYPRRIDFAGLAQIAADVDATFMVDMAHFAGLVAGKVFTGDYDPVPHADVVTTTTHKSLRGPGRHGAVQPGLRRLREEAAPWCSAAPWPTSWQPKPSRWPKPPPPDFADYAHAIVDNAQALADALLRRNARLLTGGTDNHLVVIDVGSSYGLTGRQAESALLDAGVVTNRNSIPPTPTGRGTPPGSASAPPRSPPSASAQPRSTRSPTSPPPPSQPPHLPLGRRGRPKPTTSSTTPPPIPAGAAAPNCSTVSPSTHRYSYKTLCRSVRDKDNLPIPRPTPHKRAAPKRCSYGLSRPSC